MILANVLNLNIYNVIIILGVLHGLIFSFILLFNKKLNSRTNFFLSLTILSLCFSNLQYWLIDVGLSIGYANNYLIFIPFEFLMVPMFFLYIKSYLQKDILLNLVFVLLIPFILSVIYQVLTDIFKISNKMTDFLNLIIEYGSLIFSISIIVLIFKNIRDYEIQFSIERDISKVQKTTSWLKKILFFGLLLCIVWLFSLTMFKVFFKDGYYKYYPLWIGISALIYWVAYASIFQTNIFKERKSIREKVFEPDYFKQVRFPKKNNAIEKIKELIINEKLFLDSKLSLKILSNRLDITESYISRIINENINVSFNDYINCFRVEEAKKMLADPEYYNYTIIAIGLESGFNSKSSFYKAFNKFTGKTPLEFRKYVLNI